MMPVSGYMDSNCHLRNQVPYPQHYFPGFESVPQYFKGDPPKSPMMYESWPCSNNCSRYPPVPYQGCCNHGNFPGYYYNFRPPFSHFAPSPAFHHYPNYPSFPEPYPFYYAPPPHYSSEQPRYEYDKDLHRNYHCCGCANHLHNQKNEGLKIEEQESDAQKMEGNSLVPVQPRSSPYPIVWIPSDYMKSKEHGKANDRSEVSDSDKHSGSSKPTGQQPRVQNGWFPLDMNELKSLMQGEGEKQSRNQQNQDKMMHFPFPFFWVPSSDQKQEEDENRDKRRMITASDHSEQAPVSVEPYVSDAKIDKPRSDKEISQNKNDAETRGKTASQRSIEVKEGKSEGSENRGRDVSVKRDEDTSKSAVGSISKGKSLSPKKTSKLPPVCLRVDPLPKKRSGNGSSRSPSPPKGQPENTSTMVSPGPGLKEDSAVNTKNVSGSLHNVEPGEKKREDIPVIDARSKESKAGETTDVSQAQVPVNLEEEPKASFKEVMRAEKKADSVKAANPDEPAQCKKEVKRMLSDEAAKVIQSAFRGFEVRKWEPLKKLKQLADVREQVDEVRNRIQSLESSSDRDKDDKLRLLIGEKIMSLLLWLDTIQGLHSSVRDARKSLVKELVILQERLDSLTSKWAEEKAKDLGKAESADWSSDQASENVSMEKESENESAALEDTNENVNNIEESEQTHIMDGKDEETTDAEIEDNTMEVASDPKFHTAPRNEDDVVSPDLEHMAHMSSVPEQKLSDDDFVEVSYVKDEEVEVNDQIRVDDNLEDDKLKSLIKADIMDALCEPEKETGNSNGEKESDPPINASLSDEEEHVGSTEKDQEVDLIKGLPVGVTDEEPKIDEHIPEAESYNSVKNEKENELTNNPELEVEMDWMEVSADNKSESSSKPEEVHSTLDMDQMEINADNKSEEVHSSLEMDQMEVTADNKSESFIKPEEVHSTLEVEQKEVNDDNESESFLKPEEVHSTVGEENNDKLQQHEDDSCMIPTDLAVSSESEAGSETTQEKQVLIEEKKGVDQIVGIEEKDDAPPESNADHELAKSGEDTKLIEENKKLQEMMEKLMEAGKDQLSVISNLTERVKELEEKLARTKKSSKPGNRKVRYAPSHYKPMKSKRRVHEVAK